MTINPALNEAITQACTRITNSRDAMTSDELQDEFKQFAGDLNKSEVQPLVEVLTANQNASSTFLGILFVDYLVGKRLAKDNRGQQKIIIKNFYNHPNTSVNVKNFLTDRLLEG